MRQFCHICKKQVDLTTDHENGAMKCILCGTVLFTPHYAKLNFGTIVNGFLIESKIGQGGMGVVYKAKQLNLERYVALKVLSEHLANDQEFVERFFKEARAAANLNHQNIVQVYDAGSTIEGIYYFAMELIEGETLESRLMRDGLLPPKEALDIAVKIARALEYAWEKQKLTHGDIKPDNIIINSSGGVKLADLGLAKTAHDDKSTRDGGIMATPLYAPPEIISGNISKIGFKSDMYSFGATVYHMLAGVPPFNAEDPEIVLRMHLTDKHIPLKLKNRELNPVISDLVDKLLAKNPDERPDAWVDVASSLEKIKDLERKVFHISSHSPEKDLSENELSEHDEGTKIYRLLFALAVLFLILSASTAFIYFHQFKTKSNKPSQNGKTTQTSSESDMNKEWEIIKSRTGTMSSQDAIALVERFMEKYQGSLPQDAAQFYESLKKKVLQEISDTERKQKMLQVFSSQIDSVIKEFSDTNNFKNKDFTELNFQAKKVETLISLASSNKLDMDIDKTTREKLNNIYLYLTQTINATRKIEEETFKRQLEEERLKGIEQQRLQKEKAERERAELLAVNIILDSYYLALSEDLDPVKMNSILSEIIKESGAKVPEKIRQNIEFIRGNYVSAPNAIVKELCKVENILKNKPLPLSGSLKDYKVEEISEKGIKLYAYIDKVKIGKIIQWQQLSRDDFSTILDKTLISNNEYIPAPVDLAQFSSYLVQNRQFESLRSLLAKLTDKKNPKIKLWLNFISDLEYAEKEKNSIQKMSELREFLSAKDPVNTAEKLSEMIVFHSSSETYKRYQSEINLLISELSPFSGLIQSAIFLYSANKLIVEKNFNSALQNVYCANARFANASSGKDEFKNISNELEKKCMASLLNSKEIPKTFAPFYFWEREKIAESFAFIERTKSNSDIQRSANRIPDLQNLVEASVSLSIGNWTSVSIKPNSIDEISELQGPASFMIPSLIFASYLYADQKGLNHIEQRINALFQKSAERFSKSKIGFPLTQYLFAEYLISEGRFQRASELLSSYEIGNIDNNFESRLLLLGLYCKLNLPAPMESLQKDIPALIEILKNHEQLAGDIIWLDTAFKIMFGENPDQKILEALTASDPRHFDISHRIMLSAIAIRTKNSGMPKSAYPIFKLIRNKMTGMTAQSLTFRNMAYLRLFINSYSLEAFESETIRILSEPLVAAIPLYPEMTMLQIAASSSLGKISRENARQMMLDRLSESSVSSPIETICASKILSSENYLPFLADCVAKGQVNKAFSSAIAFMIFSSGLDQAFINNIEAEMQNHQNILSIEQRLLLSAIARLARR